MVIDLDRCTACGACVLACKSENNIPAVGAREAARGRDIAWMEIVPEVEGAYPDVRMRFLPRPCMHCDNPPCIKVCPVHATYKDPEGAVAQIFERCIGCRFCMAACPYNAKFFNWSKYGSAREREGLTNPDVSIRSCGVVEKCTFCHHRLLQARDRARAEGRDLAAGDYVPACAESCPTRAIMFGDLDDPESEVARLSKSVRAFRLLSELGTEPKVTYLLEKEKTSVESA
jgi:molybdopterin-containing oxidoreductase family iron-sulfur binding subunit